MCYYLGAVGFYRKTIGTSMPPACQPLGLQKVGNPYRLSLPPGPSYLFYRRWVYFNTESLVLAFPGPSCGVESSESASGPPPAVTHPEGCARRPPCITGLLQKGGRKQLHTLFLVSRSGFGTVGNPYRLQLDPHRAMHSFPATRPAALAIEEWSY